MNLSLNNHWMRKALQLSLNEMAVLCEIYSLSNNTDHQGWCFKSKQKIGEMLDLSKTTVVDICNTLELKGYINKHPQTKFLQPTNWIRYVAQEQENFAFMVQTEGFVLASAKMQSILEEKMGRSESLPSVGKLTESVKKVVQGIPESLPKYNNSNTNSNTSTPTPKKDDEEKHEKFIQWFNTQLGKKKDTLPRFQGKDQKTRRQVKALLATYKSEDIRDALQNCLQDGYHVETQYKYVTPEYFTRLNIFEKYLNQ